MKLRNKKTGEIGTLTLSNDGETFILMNERMYTHSVKLSDLEEWEDYEEPKEYWAIDCFSPDGELVSQFSICSERIIENRKEIGNYFKTREEAEKAVEKLKAWKRVKDKGFRFYDCKIEISEIVVPEITITAFIETEEPETLNLVGLLFGGEE